MKKKIIIIVLSVLFLILASFLIFKYAIKPILNNETNNKNQTEEEDKDQDTSKKIAIIYFSATGTTKKVAEYIKDINSGDLIEIIPKEKYTDKDLNYGDNNSRATKEQEDISVRPEIENQIDTTSYDVIFLGYPIWWGTSPRIILTFLDTHDLSGKTVIPFCTSGTSSITSSVDYFKNNYQNVNFKEGRRLTTSKSEIENWIQGLDY